MRTTDTACAPGANHLDRGPVSAERRRAMRRLRDEGRTPAFIASHFGVSLRRAQKIIRPRTRKTPASSSPALAVAVTP